MADAEDISKQRFQNKDEDACIGVIIIICVIALWFIFFHQCKANAIFITSWENSRYGIGGTPAIVTLNFNWSMLIPIVLFWGLAERITGKLRSNLPSIAIVLGLVFFSLFVFTATTPKINDLFPTGGRTSLIIFTIVSLFFWRFHHPFALFLAALYFCWLQFIGLTYFNSDLIGSYGSLIVFIQGSGLFALATWCDLKDPNRETCVSDYGFWLHLAAAPCLIFFIFRPFYAMDFPLSLLVAISFLFVSSLSLLMDRPVLAFLSTLFILPKLIGIFGYFTHKFTQHYAIFLVIAIILIPLLSIYWHPIRRWLFSKLPAWAFLKKLPPLRT